MAKIKHPFFRFIILKELLRAILFLKKFSLKNIKNLKIVWDDLPEKTGGCFYFSTNLIGINPKHSYFFKKILRHELAHFFVGHYHNEYNKDFQENLCILNAPQEIYLTSKMKGV